MGETLFISFVSAYLLFTFLIIVGWWRAIFLNNERGFAKVKSPASIIIPFRNEVERLAPLINSIKSISDKFPGSEFIFINDHSDDDSIKLLETEFKDFSGTKIISLAANQSGKKAAISYGISQAKYNNIITTDADCELTESAINSMLEKLSSKNIQMVCGPVSQYSGEGFVGRLADVEFLSLIGSGISFWGLGMPLMANGAFLGFKKTAFESVNGFGGNEQFPGGDDVFLLHKILERFGVKSIHFLANPKDIIQTKGDFSIAEFISRRIRWGAKAKAYQSLSSKVFTLFVLLVNLLFISAVFYAGAFCQWQICLATIIVKLIADFLTLSPIVIRFKKWNLLAYIITASLIHPFYIIFSGALSQLGKYSWKKRNYNN